jgi:hypothetical protein
MKNYVLELVYVKHMFVVKQLNNKTGGWHSITLIREDGHFYEEARFESKSDAEAYTETE